MYAMTVEKGQLVIKRDFEPNYINWLVRADMEGQETIYFINIKAFNMWAGTPCHISSFNIRRGYCNGYTLTSNF